MQRAANQTEPARQRDLGSRVGELVFRVRGPEDDGRIVRLPMGKSSIGADPTCTVEVPAVGDECLYCLILHGPGGTIVRNWSDETRLNGRRFSDARLALGDRLQVGAMEFELISEPTSNGLSGESESGDASCAGTLDPGTHMPAAEPSDPTQAELLQQLRAELGALTEQREAWNEERTRWQSELGRCTSEVSELRARFEQFQRTRQLEQDSWLEQIRQLQRLLEVAMSSAEAPMAEDASAQSDAIEDVESQADEAEHSRQEEEFEARAARFLGDATGRREAVDSVPAERDAMWPEPTSPDRSPEDDWPLAVDGHGEDEEDEADPTATVRDGVDLAGLTNRAEPVTASEPPVDASPPGWLKDYESADGEVDSSITEYMARLLGHNQENRSTIAHKPAAADFDQGPEHTGPPSACSVADERSGIEAERSAFEAEADDADAVDTGQPEASATEGPPVKYAPRRLALEPESSLVAMRELANASAHTAIRRFDKTRTARKAWQRLPLLAIELAAGGALLYCAMVTQQMLLCVAGAVTLAAAGLTGIQLAGLLLKVAWKSRAERRVRKRMAK